MLRKRKENPAPEVELPVTPLLDMTFQLLAFFLLTFQPPSIQEGQLEFILPANTEAAGPSGTEPADLPPSSEQLDLTGLTLILKTQRDGVNDGALSAIIVRTPEGESAMSNLAQLQKFLKSRRADRSAKDNVRLQAEPNLKYAYVIAAMDACIQSGFPRVEFASLLD